MFLPQENNGFFILICRNLKKFNISNNATVRNEGELWYKIDIDEEEKNILFLQV